MYNRNQNPNRKYENPNYKNLSINTNIGERFRDRKDHFSPVEEKESLTPKFSPKFQYKRQGQVFEVRSPNTPITTFYQNLGLDEEDIEILRQNQQISREMKELEDKELMLIEQGHEISCNHTNLKLELDYLDKKMRL